MKIRHLKVILIIGVKMEEKLRKLLKFMDEWMSLREQGITLTRYCKERNVKSVGVYGYGKLGRHLIWELENEDFHIPWIMDQRCDAIKIVNKDCKMLSPTEMTHMPAVDIIIVTALEDYYRIEAQLCKYTKTEVVSIEQILTFIQEK